jgi:ribosomal protein L11 methyltransferase
MEALARWIEPSHVVLDVGTGSGILAIAARLLGARQVFTCDNDLVASQVACANIQLNAENDVYTFCGSVDAVQSSSVGLLLGNLTSDVIMGLLSEFNRVLKTNGIAILSGILLEQAEDLRPHIKRCGFRIDEEITRGEWLAVVAAKQSRSASPAQSASAIARSLNEGRSIK